jgi:ABC-type lipoprotein export system ATPase subunit
MIPVLTCDNVSHTFGFREAAEAVLRDVSLSFFPRETCVLMGPSGSGKTTLLSILGCLLAPSAGRLWLAGEPVAFDAPARLARLRRERLGFVFQQAQLLPFLTVAENLETAGRNAGLSSKVLIRRVDELLQRLDISRTRHKRPDQMSGGQRQRAAIARALLHCPPIILADEPTAALDWHHGEAAVRLLVEQAQAECSFLLVVTHDARLLPLFGRHLSIADGFVREVTAQ